jgi:putative mRNA 3-end processing factor
MARTPLIELRPEGLYCAAGDFHIDPWRAVRRALITHAHADHARPGSEQYLATTATAALLQRRYGAALPVAGVDYGDRLRLGEVRVSFHPAGHILGSAQVRIEHRGEVWVVTGDYKRAADPTCRPFEPLRCHVLISEATFALPCYRWPDPTQVADQIQAWWNECAASGRAAVLFCYALGKAQRVLALLRERCERPIYLHGAIGELLEPYRARGVALAPTRPWQHALQGRAADEGALVLAPPAAAGSPWLRRFGPISTACASGWMQIRGQRRRRGVDRGFVLSDHADWPALLATIADSGAERVYFTHGQSEALARWLTESGVAVASLACAYDGEHD